MNNQYIALTFKIVDGKMKSFQKEKSILKKLEEKFKNVGAIKPFTLIRGGYDELQGLFDNSLNKFEIKEIYNLMSTIFYPHELYLGVGYGNVSNTLEEIKSAKNSYELTGQCFENSRRALNQAIEINRKIIFNKEDKTNEISGLQK